MGRCFEDRAQFIDGAAQFIDGMTQFIDGTTHSIDDMTQFIDDTAQSIDGMTQSIDDTAQPDVRPCPAWPAEGCFPSVRAPSVGGGGCVWGRSGGGVAVLVERRAERCWDAGWSPGGSVATGGGDGA